MLKKSHLIAKSLAYIWALLIAAPDSWAESKEANNKESSVTTEQLLQQVTKEFSNIADVENEILTTKRGDNNYTTNKPFFRLTPLRVPIIQNGVWKADLFCRLECEIQNDADYSNVSLIFYTLVDAVFTTFYKTLGERFVVKSPLEVETWRPLIKEAINQYIPIKNVYFRQFCLIEYKGTPPTSALRTR